MSTDRRNYCLDPYCDEEPEVKGELCRTHQDEEAATHRKLTRQERLQGMADRGTDTWEEYRGER